MTVSVIRGEHALPGGFDHPHASDQARAIAEAGLILRVQVGSGVHGTPDRGWVNDGLHQTHLAYWNG